MNKPASRIKSRRVTRYETSDGKLHDTLWQARRHEIKLALHELIKHDEHLAVREVDTFYVVELLVESAAELAPLLRKIDMLDKTIISKPGESQP